mmetsp:Transcript_37333/g.84592  ORF Transcript_37333/g.84592 Transcript_37333/m.84592 type:complete len:243 (-) Transcript_37333:351-1079(-)
MTSILVCVAVSLFNMYPEGTFGRTPVKNDSVLSFAHIYRRRFRGRNALTCFISGATWCDSIGALATDQLGPADLRVARFNLLHRYAVFGIVERAEESQALIAWTFGWLEFYRTRFNNSETQSHSGRRRRPAHIAPGGKNRRLSLSNLCSLDGFLHEMQVHERLDIILYRFALGVYRQRLSLIPDSVLLATDRESTLVPTGKQAVSSCVRSNVPDERMPLVTTRMIALPGVNAADAAVSPDGV